MYDEYSLRIGVVCVYTEKLKSNFIEIRWKLAKRKTTVQVVSIMLHKIVLLSKLFLSIQSKQIQVDLKSRKYDFSQTASNEYYFGILADPQLGMFQTYEKSSEYRAKFNIKPGNNGSDFQLELNTLKAAIENILTIDPVFIVILGDLVNQVPLGAVKKNLKGLSPEQSNEINKLQYSSLKIVFDEVEVPIFVLPGNHDLGDDFEKKALKIYNKQWGADYYQFVIGETGFLFLNSQHWKNKVNHEAGEQQFVWIEETLNLWTIRGKMNRLVIFTHIPFWKNSRNEFVEKNSSHEGQVLRKEITDRFFLLVETYFKGEVKIFAGHVHRDIVSMNGLQVIQNALSQTLKGNQWRFLDDGGYRIGKISPENGLQTKFFRFDAIPARFDNLLENETKARFAIVFIQLAFVVFMLCSICKFRKKKNSKLK